MKEWTVRVGRSAWRDWRDEPYFAHYRIMAISAAQAEQVTRQLRDHQGELVVAHDAEVTAFKKYL